MLEVVSKGGGGCYGQTGGETGGGWTGHFLLLVMG